MPDNINVSAQRRAPGFESNTYSRLQAWYLARLRSEATKLSQQVRLLTPLARIDTDRQLLERMVMEATVQDAVPVATRQKTNWIFVAWSVLTLSGLAILIFAEVAAYVLSIYVTAALLTIAAYIMLAKCIRQARIQGVRDFWQVLQGYGLDLPDINTVADDIERKLAQTLLEARLRELAIADYAPDLILAFDDKLNITCCNVSSFRILGSLPAELVTRSLEEVLVHPSAEEFRHRLKESKDGTDQNFALTVVSKNGQLIELDVHCEWSNRQQLFFAAATDTTSTRQMERARSDFIAMISHDVTRPLQNLLFTIESLKTGGHGQVDDRASDALGRVENNVQSVIDLVSELMDFERSAETSLLLARTEFDLGELIDATVEQVQDLATTRSITLLNESDSIAVVADRARLTRVVLNLLLNALKFSPQKSEIRIHTEKRDNNAIVRISDQGHGIPPHLVNAIFNRYFQATTQVEDDQAGRMKGAGLGLAICKVFVEAHDGTIGVQSTVGKGSTFWFSIPIAPKHT